MFVFTDVNSFYRPDTVRRMVAALDEANEALKTGAIHEDTVSLDDVKKELGV